MTKQSFWQFLSGTWPEVLMAFWMGVYLLLMAVSLGLVARSPLLGFSILSIACLWMLYGIYLLKRSSTEALSKEEEVLRQVQRLTPEERTRLIQALRKDEHG